MKQPLTTLLLLALLTPSQASEPVWHNVTATVYNCVPTQTDDSPLITADGHRIDTLRLKSGKERIIAVSRDLLVKFPYGSSVYVWIAPNHPKNGSYRVHDTMARRFTNAIDILTYNDRHGKWSAKIQKNP